MRTGDTNEGSRQEGNYVGGEGLFDSMNHTKIKLQKHTSLHYFFPSHTF